jgi:uncharacterized protein
MKASVWVVRTSSGLKVCDCEYADSIWFRCRGLLGRRVLAQDAGLWLKPCQSIHMFFMKFPIDAVFLSAEGEVLRVFEGIRPWRCTPMVRGAHSCLELAAGRSAATGIRLGDRLEFTKSDIDESKKTADGTGADDLAAA